MEAPSSHCLQVKNCPFLKKSPAKECRVRHPRIMIRCVVRVEPRACGHVAKNHVPQPTVAMRL